YSPLALLDPPLRATVFARRLAAPAFEGTLKGFRRREPEQPGYLAEGRFGVADIGHGQVSASVVENLAVAGAFLGQLASQRPGRQLQPLGELWQIGLVPLEQGAEQLRHAFAQTARAGALLEFGFAQLQQVMPGAGAMLGIAQRQHGLVQPQLVARRGKFHRTAEQRLVTRRVIRLVELYPYQRRPYRLCSDCAQLADPAGQHGIDDETVVG